MATGVQSGGQNYVASTTTQLGPDIASPTAVGLKLVVAVTNAGTGSIMVAIQGKDKQSGQYYPILSGTAIVANGVTVYTVFPGAPVAANVSANDMIPEIWRWNVAVQNPNPMTYSIGFSTIE